MEKKTIYIMGGSIIGVLVILILAVYIITNLKPAKYDFKELEIKIKEAAEKYYHKNPTMLPTEDGTYRLEYSTLESNKLIDPLNKITKENVACNAHVIIIKEGTSYTYIPYLSCGEVYTTRELYNQVLYNSPVVTSGSGLYQTTSGEYYFRGKIENNYVAFGSVKKRDKVIDILWQILSINNNEVKLRAVEPIKDKSVWDNRFNTTENKYFGYNDFDLSILSEYLIKLKENNIILNETENAKLVSKKLCVNARTEQDNTKDGTTECAKLSEKEYYYGTITPYEFIRASLDNECNTVANRACSNFNFISNLAQSDEWTTTPSTLSNHEVYVLDGSSFEKEKTNNKNSIFPVITLNNYAFYDTGTGTIEDPYRIK